MLLQTSSTNYTPAGHTGILKISPGATGGGQCTGLSQMRLKCELPTRSLFSFQVSSLSQRKPWAVFHLSKCSHTWQQAGVRKTQGSHYRKQVWEAQLPAFLTAVKKSTLKIEIGTSLLNFLFNMLFPPPFLKKLVSIYLLFIYLGFRVAAHCLLLRRTRLKFRQ